MIAPYFLENFWVGFVCFFFLMQFTPVLLHLIIKNVHVSSESNIIQVAEVDLWLSGSVRFNGHCSVPPHKPASNPRGRRYFSWGY